MRNRIAIVAAALLLVSAIFVWNHFADFSSDTPTKDVQKQVAARGDSAYIDGNRQEWQFSIPAAAYDKLQPAGGRTWIVTDGEDDDPSGFMRVSRADGTLFEAGYAESSPRLDYELTFRRRGIYYIWIRGRGASNAASLHVGLDGHPLETSDRIYGFGPKARRYYWRLPWPKRHLRWSRHSLDHVPAFIEIADIGTHTLNVWARSDDMLLGKILLTTDERYEPHFSGPSPSQRARKMLRAPKISVSSGVFYETIEVRLDAHDPSAAILFTVDDTNPSVSESTKVYRVPIQLTGSATVGAIARADHRLDSDIAKVTLQRINCSPIRIMPLGDSITYGIYGPIEAGPLVGMRGGYRAPLYRKLRQSNYAVDFVGQLRAGGRLDPPIDPDNEGRDGWTSRQIAQKVYRFLAQSPADIVLLHAGTNGMTGDTGAVATILDEIDRYENDSGQSVLVLLARIINRRSPHIETSTFNDSLETLASKRNIAGDNISIVDMEGALEYPENLYDDLHPNKDGYDKMSQAWYEALLPHLTPCVP